MVKQSKLEGKWLQTTEGTTAANEHVNSPKSASRSRKRSGKDGKLDQHETVAATEHFNGPPNPSR